MDFLLGISRAIDRVNTIIGRSVGWLIFASIVVSAGNATIRKVFSISSNSALELQWHFYGAAILLASAYTLMRGEHVRIDIFYNQMSPKWRNIIDLGGTIIVLMPFSALGAYETWGWVLTSYAQQEYSSNFGGLLQWPVKSSILIGFVLLFFQGISEIIKRIAVLSGRIPDPHAKVTPHGGDATIEGAV